MHNFYFVTKVAPKFGLLLTLKNCPKKTIHPIWSPWWDSRIDQFRMKCETLQLVDIDWAQ
jgi:hypothetical protein